MKQYVVELNGRTVYGCGNTRAELDEWVATVGGKVVERPIKKGEFVSHGLIVPE